MSETPEDHAAELAAWRKEAAGAFADLAAEFGIGAKTNLSVDQIAESLRRRLGQARLPMHDRLGMIVQALGLDREKARWGDLTWNDVVGGVKALKERVEKAEAGLERFREVVEAKLPEYVPAEEATAGVAETAHEADRSQLSCVLGLERAGLSWDQLLVAVGKLRAPSGYVSAGAVEVKHFEQLAKALGVVSSIAHGTFMWDELIEKVADLAVTDCAPASQAEQMIWQLAEALGTPGPKPTTWSEMLARVRELHMLETDDHVIEREAKRAAAQTGPTRAQEGCEALYSLAAEIGVATNRTPEEVRASLAAKLGAKDAPLEAAAADIASLRAELTELRLFMTERTLGFTESRGTITSLHNALQAPSDRVDRKPPEPPRVPGHITCTSGVCGGKPCLDGTRIPVDALWSFIEVGHTDAEILREYPTLTDEDTRVSRALFKMARRHWKQKARAAMRDAFAVAEYSEQT